jgi:hypothetical protein
MTETQQLPPWLAETPVETEEIQRVATLQLERFWDGYVADRARIDGLRDHIDRLRAENEARPYREWHRNERWLDGVILSEARAIKKWRRSQWFDRWSKHPVRMCRINVTWAYRRSLIFLQYLPHSIYYGVKRRWAR